MRLYVHMMTTAHDLLMKFNTFCLQNEVQCLTNMHCKGRVIERYFCEMGTEVQRFMILSCQEDIHTTVIQWVDRQKYIQQIDR